ncbi:MAG: hypothetical protein AAB611_03495 [Patescibacteria group bacterium]
MTQEEIRKRRGEIKVAQDKLKEESDKLKGELHELQKECVHPSVIVGEWDNFEYCQDCGAIN